MQMSELKKNVTQLLTAMALFTFACSGTLSAEIWGKVDVAPAYVHIDVLEHQRTVHRMDMIAFKGDATIVVWKGLCIKPTLLAGTGGGDIVSTGAGIGHCTPICDWLVLTPSVGCLYTNLTTHIDLDIPFPVTPISPDGKFHLHRVKENFWSISPYIGLDATFRITCDWRIYAQVQYAWSRTHTTLTKHHALPTKANGAKFQHKDTSKANGPSYGLMVEYDVTDCISVNLGGAYNLSLTKEKHGLRGAGCKLGLAYWF